MLWSMFHYVAYLSLFVSLIFVFLDLCHHLYVKWSVFHIFKINTVYMSLLVVRLMILISLHLVSAPTIVPPDAVVVVVRQFSFFEILFVLRWPRCLSTDVRHWTGRPIQSGCSHSRVSHLLYGLQTLESVAPDLLFHTIIVREKISQPR